MRGLALALLAAGCSWTFDPSEPVPLVGPAPPLPAHPRIVLAGDVTRVEPVRGADGANWVLLREVNGSERLVRLALPEAEETLPDGRVEKVGDRIFITTGPPQPGGKGTLTVRRAGDDGVGWRTDLADQEGLYAYSPDGTAFITWDRGPTYHLARVGGAARALPATQGRNGNYSLIPVGFSEEGDWLFTCEPSADPMKCTLRRYSTGADPDVDLGLFPSSFPLTASIYRGIPLIVDCGPAGVRTITFDGVVRLLDPMACAPLGRWIRKGALRFYDLGGLRSVPLDGSGPPVELFQRTGTQAVLADGDTEVAYSTQPLFNPSTDGWIGDWKFMERGDEVRFGRLAGEVRWREHTAREYVVGDLLSATIPRGAPLTLARNVRDWEELPDGRIVAASNQAYLGPQNRVIAVDVAAREARWLADDASAFEVLPGAASVLVWIGVTGGSVELVEVPLPPR
jgi:hypothetical protein